VNVLVPLVIGFFVHPEDTIREYGLTPETNFRNPSILFNRFDVSWDRWFKRIGSWGKIKILYVSPEQRKRERISQDQFLVLIDTPEMLQVYEKFQVEQSNIHKFEIWCRYIGKDGREYKDIIQFNVDLIPELQRGLNWWQKIF